MRRWTLVSIFLSMALLLASCKSSKTSPGDVTGTQPTGSTQAPGQQNGPTETSGEAVTQTGGEPSSPETTDFAAFTQSAFALLSEQVSPDKSTLLTLHLGENDAGGYYYVKSKLPVDMRSGLSRYFSDGMVDNLLFVSHVKETADGYLVVPADYAHYYEADPGGVFAVTSESADKVIVSVPFTVSEQIGRNSTTDNGTCELRRDATGTWKVAKLSQWYNDYALAMNAAGYAPDPNITKAGWLRTGASYNNKKIDFTLLAGEKNTVFSLSGKYALKLKRVKGDKEDTLVYVISDRNGGEVYTSSYPISEYFTYYVAWDEGLDKVWAYVGVPAGADDGGLFSGEEIGLISSINDGGYWTESHSVYTSDYSTRIPGVFKLLSGAVG